MITKTRNLVHTATFLVLGMALSSLHAPRAAAPAPKAPQDVHVINAAADPVPVKIDGTTNTVKIDGNTNTIKIDGTTNTVKAAQSGTWTVGFSGTPTVALSGSSTVSLASGAAVQIGNTAISPVLVRSFDRPIAQPVRAILSSTFQPNFGATTTFNSTFTVPFGKRLVIEFVTVNISLPNSQQAQFARLDSTGFNQYITLTAMGNDAAGRASFVATHRIFVILEPGTVVEAFAVRNSGTESGTVTMSISGYLADI